MHVNGARLYFDVEGSGLVADGPKMRERPTLLLLHGGPGADHAVYKPAFSKLVDIAQIVYLDHRGNGRSEGNDPADWNLKQWGKDVRAFCDALGIEKPVVCGTSFGGFVAQSYATQFPQHPGKLILISTAAKADFEKIFDAFETLVGTGARQVAEEYWLTPTSESRARYRDVCVPFYQTTGPEQPDWLSRIIMKDDVALWFNGPRNEHGRMDFREGLGRIECPVLVMVGDRDPITPLPFSEEIAACMPPELVRFERFANCGHGVVGDVPDLAFEVIREFIESDEQCRTPSTPRSPSPP